MASPAASSFVHSPTRSVSIPSFLGPHHLDFPSFLGPHYKDVPLFLSPEPSHEVPSFLSLDEGAPGVIAQAANAYPPKNETCGAAEFVLGGTRHGDEAERKAQDSSAWSRTAERTRAWMAVSASVMSRIWADNIAHITFRTVLLKMAVLSSVAVATYMVGGLGAVASAWSYFGWSGAGLFMQLVWSAVWRGSLSASMVYGMQRLAEFSPNMYRQATAAVLPERVRSVLRGRFGITDEMLRVSFDHIMQFGVLEVSTLGLDLSAPGLALRAAQWGAPTVARRTLAVAERGLDHLWAIVGRLRDPVAFQNDLHAAITPRPGHPHGGGLTEEFSGWQSLTEAAAAVAQQTMDETITDIPIVCPLFVVAPVPPVFVPVPRAPPVVPTEMGPRISITETAETTTSTSATAAALVAGLVSLLAATTTWDDAAGLAGSAARVLDDWPLLRKLFFGAAVGHTGVAGLLARFAKWMTPAQLRQLWVPLGVDLNAQLGQDSYLFALFRALLGGRHYTAAELDLVEDRTALLLILRQHTGSSPPAIDAADGRTPAELRAEIDRLQSERRGATVGMLLELVGERAVSAGITLAVEQQVERLWVDREAIRAQLVSPFFTDERSKYYIPEAERNCLNVLIQGQNFVASYVGERLGDAFERAEQLVSGAYDGAARALTTVLSLQEDMASVVEVATEVPATATEAEVQSAIHARLEQAAARRRTEQRFRERVGLRRLREELAIEVSQDSVLREGTIVLSGEHGMLPVDGLHDMLDDASLKDRTFRPMYSRLRNAATDLVVDSSVTAGTAALAPDLAVADAGYLIRNTAAGGIRSVAEGLGHLRAIDGVFRKHGLSFGGRVAIERARSPAKGLDTVSPSAPKAPVPAEWQNDRPQTTTLLGQDRSMWTGAKPQRPTTGILPQWARQGEGGLMEAVGNIALSWAEAWGFQKTPTEVIREAGEQVKRSIRVREHGEVSVSQAARDAVIDAISRQSGSWFKTMAGVGPGPATSLSGDGSFEGDITKGLFRQFFLGRDSWSAADVDRTVDTVGTGYGATADMARRGFDGLGSDEMRRGMGW